MARPQPGSIFPPQNHTVSLVYHVEDLGVNAMSVSKIAAMVAGLAEEKDKFGHEAKINYMIGFGVRFWSLVFHLNLPKAFESFRPTILKQVDPAEIGGDFFIFLSSQNSEWNSRLLSEIEENLSDLTETVDHFDGAFVFLTDLNDNEKTLISSEDPEFSGGSFTLRLSFLWNENDESEINLAKKFRNYIESEDFKKIMERFSIRSSLFESKNQLLLMLLAKTPEQLENVLQEIHQIESSFFLFLEFGSYAFVPSVDVLTGLRMGGLRMGKLSPTAKFKLRPI
jgi:porphyrinogen peroxidase